MFINANLAMQTSYYVNKYADLSRKYTIKR